MRDKRVFRGSGSQKKNVHKLQQYKNYSIQYQQIDKRIAILTQVHLFAVIFFFHIHIIYLPDSATVEG
jgi:hypothetical protein